MNFAKLWRLWRLLSGAGPTVLVLTPPENTEKLVTALKAFDHEALIDVLSVEKEGVQIF